MPKTLVIDLGAVALTEALQNQDFILTTRKSARSNEAQIQFHSANTLPELSQEINDFFEALPGSIQFMKNDFYAAFYRPYQSLVYQIEAIRASHSIGKIILLGGAKFRLFGVKNGMGEGNPMFFNKALMLNTLLYQQYHGQLEVVWQHKDTWLKAAAFQCLRFVFESLQFVKFFVVNLFAKNTDIEGQSKKADVVGIVDTQVKARLLKKLVIREQAHLMVIPKSESAQLGGEAIFYQFRLVDVLAGLRAALSMLSLIGVKSKPAIGNIRLSWGVFGMSSIPEIISYQIKKRALARTMKKLKAHNPDLIYISNSTFGTDMVVMRDAAHDAGLQLKNYQCVSFAPVWYPDMELANEYYLYDRNSFQFYQKRSPSYRYYMPDLSINRKKYEKLKSSPEIIIFTQPDDFADFYIDFLQQFADLKTDMGLKVKLHYRQNKVEDFVRLSNDNENIEILEQIVDVAVLLETCDLAMSVSSSVLQQATFIGCPGVIYATGNEPVDAVAKTICFPEINFIVKSAFELLKVAEEYELNYRQYEQKRNNFYEVFGE